MMPIMPVGVFKATVAPWRRILAYIVLHTSTPVSRGNPIPTWRTSPCAKVIVAEFGRCIGTLFKGVELHFAQHKTKASCCPSLEKVILWHGSGIFAVMLDNPVVCILLINCTTCVSSVGRQTATFVSFSPLVVDGWDSNSNGIINADH